MEHFGFLTYRQGNKKIKEFKYGNYTIPIRQYLQDRGFEMPKILNIINNTATIIVVSEWIEGKDFLFIAEDFINKKVELGKQNKIAEEVDSFIMQEENIIADNFYKWGVYMAKMH